MIRGSPNLSKSAGPANPVQICLTIGFAVHVHWKVEVHHNGHLKQRDGCLQEANSQSTCSMSIPLERTLVVMRIFSRPSLNLDRSKLIKLSQSDQYFTCQEQRVVPRQWALQRARQPRDPRRSSSQQASSRSSVCGRRSLPGGQQCQPDDIKVLQSMATVSIRWFRSVTIHNSTYLSNSDDPIDVCYGPIFCLWRGAIHPHLYYK